jgi:hypothetical protein
MGQVRSWAGLDVHARSVLAVTMDADTGELRSQRLSGDTAKVVEFCSSLPGLTRVAATTGSPAPLVELSWKAHRRLYRVWQRLRYRAWETPPDRRGRRRERTCRVLLGDHHRRLIPCQHHVGCRGGRRLALAREHPRSVYEQPRQARSRSILESALTTKAASCGHRAKVHPRIRSDRASRTSRALPPLQPTRCPPCPRASGAGQLTTGSP